MTNEQARDILDTLQQEMDSNGFGEIFRIVQIRAQENYSQEHSILRDSDTMLLKFYLSNIISILQVLSSASLKETIERLNEFSINEDRSKPSITNITIDLINDEQIDLSELPDYSDLTKVLSEILFTIIQE